MARRVREISKLTKGMMIYLAALALVLIVIAGIERMGYRLIWTSVHLMGGLLIVWSLLAWGAIALFRKLKGKTARMVAGLGLGLVVVFAGMLMFTFAAQFAQLVYPSSYATIRSSSGREAVLMYAVDTGFESEEEALASQERMDTRKAHLIEEGVEVEEEGYPFAAYGYVFRAYPKVAKIFYRPDADTEGAIYRGAESEAKILYEWTEEDVLRVYLENPEVADSGEILVHFD